MVDKNIHTGIQQPAHQEFIYVPNRQNISADDTSELISVLDNDAPAVFMKFDEKEATDTFRLGEKRSC